MNAYHNLMKEYSKLGLKLKRTDAENEKMKNLAEAMDQILEKSQP